MNRALKVKQGDTIPLNGRVRITEDGLDMTVNEDFTQWVISCDLVGPDGVKVIDVDLQFFEDTPVYAGVITSGECATLAIGSTYSLDIRFLDGLGNVMSSGTQQIQIVKAVSAVPA